MVRTPALSGFHPTAYVLGCTLKLAGASLTRSTNGSPGRTPVTSTCPSVS
jgi:hypothetical protein